MNTVEIIIKVFSIGALVVLIGMMVAATLKVASNYTCPRFELDEKKQYIKYLSKFNEKLLNGALPKMLYKNLYSVIQTSKTVDVNKIIPNQCNPVTLVKGKCCEPYSIGEVFLDENKKFRLAIEQDLVENGDTEYINKCLTLDEIEKKVPFAEIIEQYEAEEKAKEESRLELLKLNKNDKNRECI